MEATKVPRVMALGKERLAQSYRAEPQVRACWESIALLTQGWHTFGLMGSSSGKRNLYISILITNRLLKHISIIPSADKYTKENTEHSNRGLTEQGHVH